MNERLLEFVKQAGISTTDHGRGLFIDDHVSLGDLEKFAELIVRECVGKCEFVADMATITNTGEMARKTKATADSCATMIKQHFGVKE